jgi:phospholipid-binding lipoprotein MlaA
MPVALRVVALSAALLLSGACASTDQLSAPDARAESDPWEPMNRQVDAFNTAVDKVTLKPLAKGYRAVFPGFARQGVSNFFANLGTPAVALNNFLQGKGGDGFVDIGRFLMNSTVGLGGLIDVGTEFGLEEHDEDFGQTLAVWGVGDGPYVVIPFLGPSTLRDALATPLDYLSQPLTYYENTSVRDKLRVLQIIDIRTRLLAAERFLEDSSDPYITLRESYLQNRNYKVYDGDPPMDDDFYDDMLDEEY